jgi:hypothetical protein
MPHEEVANLVHEELQSAVFFVQFLAFVHQTTYGFLPRGRGIGVEVLQLTDEGLYSAEDLLTTVNVASHIVEALLDISELV